MARKPKAEADTPETRPEPEAIESDVMAVVEATEPLQKASDAETTATAEPVEVRDQSPATASSGPAERRGSGAGAFFGMVLGGALVFAAGFGVARYMPDVLPALGTAAPVDTTAIDARLADIEGRLAAMPAPDTTLADRVAALESAPQADTAALEQRLADLESRVAQAGGSGGGVDPAALDALRAEVAALKSGGPAEAQADALATEAEARLAEVRDTAEALRAETEAAVAATRRAAALTRLSAALESGAPYGPALDDLGGDIPPVLADAAQSGLPTLASLQDSFPQAARQALDAAIQADMGAGWTERVGNFLRVQTGARSLEPREGDDPDAILSRAEAAVNAGDLPAALSEIAALPAPAQEAMADWTAAATARVQAAEAIATLAAQG